jgi:hypothetical protein
MTDFDIRPAQSSDINFIYKTFLTSYRYNSAIGKTCTNTVFFAEYQKVLDSILSKADAKVLVACHRDEPEVIFGYLIYEPGTLHYAFVKEAFQKLGIAKSLFLNAFGDQGLTDQLQVTHKTFCVHDLLERHPNLTYNPFLLFQTNKE